MPETVYQFSSPGADAVTADVNAIGAAGQSTTQQILALHQAASDAASGGLAALSDASQKLQATFAELAGALSVGFSLEQITELADAFENTQAVLENISPSAQAAQAAMASLIAISESTRTSFEGNAQAYERLTVAGQQLGLSTQEVGQIVTAMSASVALMGGNSSDTASLVNVLVRAIDSGSVSMQTLRPLLTEAPGLLEAMASAAGGTGGNVQQLVNEVASGQISVQQFLALMAEAAPQLKQQIGDSSLTMTQALRDLNTAMLSLFGSMSSGSGVTSVLAEGIETIAKALTDPSGSGLKQSAEETATVLGTALGIALIPQVPAVVAAIGSVGVAIEGMLAGINAFLMANPFTAAAIALISGYYAGKLIASSPTGSSINNLLGITQLKNDQYQSTVDSTNLGLDQGAAQTGQLSGGLNAISSMLQANQAQLTSWAKSTADAAQATLLWSTYVDPLIAKLQQQVQTSQTLDDTDKASIATQQLLIQLTNDGVTVTPELTDKLYALENQIVENKAAVDAYNQSVKDMSTNGKQASADITADFDATWKEQQTQVSATEAAYKAAGQQAAAIATAADQAGSQVVTALVNMAEGAKNPFNSLLSYAEQTFAKIAAAAILNPVIIPIITEAIGSISGAASSSEVGSAAGASALINNLGASVSSSINAFGANYLGTSLPTYTVLDEGDATAGVLPNIATSNAGTLTSYLGGAGLGATAGGLLTSLIGGNQTVGEIGGAITGALAMVPGVGPLLAGISGVTTLLASLFGPGPSNETEGYQFDPLTGASTQVGNAPGSAKFSQTNLTNAGAFQTAIEQFVTGITGAVPGSSYIGGQIGFDTGNTQGSNVYLYGPQGPGGSSLGALSGGSGNFATPQDALAATMQALTSQFTNLPADVQTAFQNIDWTGDLQTNLSLVQFAADFQSNIKAMEDGTLSIQSDAYTQAAATVQSYITQIQTFMSTTQQLGLSTTEATTATQAFVNNLINGVTPLDTWQTQLQTLQGTFSRARPLLTAVGENADQASDDLTAAVAKLGSQFTASLQSQIYSASGYDFLNSITSDLSAYQQNLSDAQALGTDPNQPLVLLNDQIAAIVESASFTTDDLNELNTVFGNTPLVMDAVTAALATVNTTADATGAAISMVSKLYTDQINTLKTTETTLNSTISSWTTATNDLTSLQSDLQTSSLNPLGLAAQVAAAQSSMQTLFQEGMAGDPTAADNFATAAKNFLTLDQQYNASDSQYASDFAMVQSMTNQLASFSGNQLSVAQQQLTVLENILAELQDEQQALTATKTSATVYNSADASSLQQGYQAALAASGLDESDFLASPSGAISIQARNNLVAGTTDPSALLNDYTNAQSQMNQPGMSSVGSSYLTAVVNQMNAVGVPVPQYAEGGWVPKTTLAVVHGGEYVATAYDMAGLHAKMDAVHAAIKENTHATLTAHEWGTGQLAAAFNRYARETINLPFRTAQFNYNAMFTRFGRKSGT